MKQIYILPLSFFFILVCGCSKSVYDGEEVDDCELVPVEFSSPRIGVDFGTKVIDPDSGLAMGNDASGLEIGVYGLETKESLLAWNPDDEDSYIQGLVNRHVTIADGGVIRFFEPEVYYPMMSTRTYSFYSYHPYEENSDNRQGECSVTFDLTQGNKDIMWAESHAQHAEVSGYIWNGFNAAYIRKTRTLSNGADYIPSFSFAHMLTALEFSALKTEDSDTGIRIVSFDLVDVATKVKLTVASDISDESGKVEAAKTGELHVLDLPDGEKYFDPDGSVISTLTLLPEKTYHARITLAVEGDEEVRDPLDVVIYTNNSETDYAFKAGYRYKITVLIKSPVEVDIETSLKDWTPVNGGSIDVE